MSEESKMDKVTTEMMEHLCDSLCRYTDRSVISEDELEYICAECKMGKYVCDILNTYNRLNDFEKTQCAKLLKKAPKWIPVSERLPEYDGQYLACLDDGYIASVEYDTDESGIQGWELWADSGEVIAWMPLPEQYKES